MNLKFFIFTMSHVELTMYMYVTCFRECLWNVFSGNLLHVCTVL